MNRVIEFIFGKQSFTSMRQRLRYWFFVIFYFVCLLLALFQTISYGNWIPVIVVAFLAPLLFRLFNFFMNLINAVSAKGMKKLGKPWFFLGIAIIAILPFFFVYLFGGGNLAVGVSQTTINGQEKVSISNLKGVYDVDSLTADSGSSGTINIPFKAEAQKGTFDLIVTAGDQVIWDQTISGQQKGIISTSAPDRTYDIQLKAKQAEGVKVSLALNN